MSTNPITDPITRSTDMSHLLQEDLARAQIADRLHEAEAVRRSRRIVAARRLHRRAERAAMQARLVLARSI
jgi:hypothetical protein